MKRVLNANVFEHQFARGPDGKPLRDSDGEVVVSGRAPEAVANLPRTSISAYAGELAVRASEPTANSSAARSAWRSRHPASQRTSNDSLGWQSVSERW